MKRFISVLFAGIAVAAPLALAQTPVPPPGTPGPIGTAGGIVDFFDFILTIIATLFWIFAAIFVLWAAFLYLTAGGSEEKIKKANSKLVYAVVAIVVGLFAFGLPFLIQNILGTQ